MFQKYVWDGDLEYGLLFEFVRYFASLGGFEKLFNSVKCLVETNSSFGYTLIQVLTTPLKNLKLILDEKFAREFVTQVKELIVTKLYNLSDSEMKELDKNAL